MKRLKLQFADRRVCSRCGAPAERIGREYRRGDDDTLDLFPLPHERRCSPHAKGAESRVLYVQEGTRRVEKPYHVQVFTHVCTRNEGERPDGTAAYLNADGKRERAEDWERWQYGCGALMLRDTVQVEASKMFGRCWTSDETMPATLQDAAGELKEGWE